MLKHLFYYKKELQFSGGLLGYRCMWNRLRITHQLNVRRLYFIYVHCSYYRLYKIIEIQSWFCYL